MREQIATMAATGVLPDGARIPTIRQLAADLGLATGTVARAYRELEADGVIVSRGRHGTFVQAVPARFSTRRVDPGRLSEAARAFAVAVHQLGADHRLAMEAAERALREVGRPATPVAPEDTGA